MSDLILHVKEKYFNQTKAGTKPFEYRLQTEYWRKRAALWAQRAAQIDGVAMHKCCVDGETGAYNTCTLDEGRPDDCSLTASGKVKKRGQCEHWRMPKAQP